MKITTYRTALAAFSLILLAACSGGGGSDSGSGSGSSEPPADTEAPTISEVLLAGDGVINSYDDLSAIALSGSTSGVEDGQVITFDIGGVGKTTSVTGNSFDTTVDLSRLADGTSIRVTADVADAAGNAASQFVGSLVKDVLAPEIASVSVEAGAHTVGSTVAITITASANEAGLSLSSRLFNGRALAEVSDNNDGTYSASYTVEEGDADVGDGGDVVVELAFTDGVANVGTTITSVSLAAGTSIDASIPSVYDVVVSGDNLVNSSDTLSAVEVSGQTANVESGQQVSLAIGGETATAPVAADGSFTADIDLSGLGADGTYTLSADVSDAAGNAADQFSGSVLIDTTKPVINSVVLSVDDVINSSDTLSAVAVSVSTTGVEDDQVVSLSVGGVKTDVAIANNGFDGTVDLSELADGTEIIVSGNVSDLAGNAAEAFTKDSFVLKDTEAPSIDSVSVSTDDVINAAEIASSVTVSGAITGVEAGREVSLAIGGVSAAASVDDSGNFTVDVDLSGLSTDGTYTLSADVADSAGNAADQFSGSVLVDTTKPSIDSVVVAGDDKVNAIEINSLVAVSGTTTDAEEGREISLNIGGKTATAQVAADGSFTADIDLSGLSADGTYILSADISDAAGNAADQFSGSVLVDTTKPSINSVVVAGDDKVNATEINSLVAVSGTTTDAEEGREISLNIGGKTATAQVAADGSFTADIDLSGLSTDGTYTLSADVSDAAGNAADQFSGSVLVDTTKPSVDSVVVAGDDKVNAVEIESAVAVSGTTTDAEEGREISLNIGGEMATAQVAADGSFTTDVDLSNLSTDGTYTLSADVSDAAGNAADQFSGSVLIDTTKPIINSVAVAGDDKVNATEINSLVAVSGTTTDAEEGREISLNIGGKTATALVAADGSFIADIDLSGLSPDATYQVTADVADSAGNAADQFSGSVIVDTTKPSIDSVVVSGDDQVNATEIASAVSVSGATTGVEAGREVSLIIGGVLAAASVDDSGNFAVDVDLSSLSADGTYTLSADVSDSAGNAAPQFSGSVLIDTTKPVINSVVLSGDDVINSSDTLASVAVSVSTSGVEDGQKLSLSVGGITAEVAVTSNVFDGTVDLSDLEDGAEIVVSGDVSDLAGNAAETFTKSIVKDTAAPTIAITSVATDGTINASEVDEVEIIGTASEDGQSVSLAITDGANTVEADTTVSNNSYSVTVDLASLDDSASISLDVTVADTAGNEGSASKTDIIKDTLAPSIVSISVAGDNVVNSSEKSDSVAVAGSTSGVEDDQQITLTINGANITTAVSGNSFSTSADLSGLGDGTYTVGGNVADAAGNPADAANVDFVIDTIPPSQKVDSASISLSTDNGSSASDFITNEAEQAISATLSASLGSGDVLYASVDGGSNWQQVDSANISGTSITWGATLAEGTNTIQFQVADSADNNGTIIKKDYTLDTTAPTQSVSSIAFSVDSGTAGDLVTNTAAQTITATLSAALGTDEILFGAVSLDGEGNPDWADITDNVSGQGISWDVTLSAGANDIQFIVEDAAGNSGEPAKQSYFFDNEAPKTNTAGTTASAAEASVANLDAGDSTDNYGIASYEWTQVQSNGSALSADDIKLSIANGNDATTTANTPGITDDDIDSLSFYFSLKITDVAGNSSGAMSTLNVSNTYTTPNITASTGAPNFDQLSLSWPTETGLTYDLHRSSAADCDLSATNNCADYQLYAALDLSDGAQTDSGLDFFSSYYYWLEAKNDDTVVSLSSTPSEANTTGPALNDTGITGGGDYPSGFDSLGDGTACNGGYLVDDNGDVISDPDNHSGNSTFVPFAAEDCELGRDADDTLNDDSDGKAGFSFTRLNSDGSEYSGDGVYSEQPWACVVDNVTGLIWEVKTTTTGNASYYDQGYTWEGASTTLAAYLNGDNFNNTDGSGLCGRTDWRLPTVQEIHGLTDYAATSAPFIDTGYFPHTLNYFYWTVDDNADPALSEDVWAYNPSNAEIVTRYTNNSSYARLVSSSEAVESHFSDYSDNRYTDHGDGTISDTKTGLMWMKCTYGQNYDSAASSICGATTAAIDGDWRDGFTNAALANDASSFGYTDWRLPNIKELGSLVDFSKYEPAAINTDIFAIPSNDTNLYYWSSTPTNNKDDQELLTQAVVIGFGQGGRYAGSHRQTSLTGYLRLVRDDANTPRILTLDINGNNVINSEDELANISVSGSTIDVEDGQQITLNIGSISTEIEVSNNGFSASVNLSTLADGIDIAVTADASDSAGRAADQFTSTLLKDTVAPSISGVLVSGDDTINSSEANAATITGTTEGVEDGQTISIAINDNADPVVKITATATVTSNAFNITNLNLSGLADGTSLSLTADVSDAAGNPATTHSFDGITKDTIAPTITIDSVATDGIINASEQSSVVINGTASENGQTVLLAISDGTNTVEADTTVSNNSYSATVDLTSFAESSSISLGVTVSDAAGNEGSASKTDIIKDTLKPSIASISVADDNVVNSSEILSPVAVSGSTSDVEDNQVITLTINGVTTTTAVNDSSFATTADLSTIGDGTYPVTANVADAAGNPADQATSNFEIDTTPPAQAVTLDSIQLSTDSGSSASDFITNQATQTIGATLSAILGTGDALYASVDGGTTWQQVDSANINGTGISWSATLLNGSSSIQFQVADSADNNGTIVTKDYTLDTTPPEQTISDIDISDDSGALNDDFLTNNPTQTITATLRGPLESGDTLHGSVDSGSKWEDITASVSGTAITWNSVTLSSGSIQLKVVDAAGNDGDVAELAYILDTTAPTIDTTGTDSTVDEGSSATLNASGSDSSGIASYAWAQVQSSSNDASEVVSTDDNYVSLNVANDGTATFTAPGIVDEDDMAYLSLYFKITLTDNAGNPATSSPLTIIVDNSYTTPTISASAVGAPDFNQISLSWSADNSLTYSLYRSTDPDCNIINYNSCTNPALYINSTGITINDTSIASVTDTDSSDSFQLFNSYYYWLGGQIGDEVVFLNSTPTIQATNSGPALNDTGITSGGDYPSGFDDNNDGVAGDGNGAVCNGGYLDAANNNAFVAFVDEDCELGRDATNNDPDDGSAGFSFTRLNSDGSEYSGNGVYNEEPWACVVDNVTGLIWEVKTTTQGNASYNDQGYTWEGANTTLSDYLNGNNFNNTGGSGLCGRSNWRLPSVQEIHGLTDYNTTYATLSTDFSPLIDTSYFSNTRSGLRYWAADVYDDASVWAYNPINGEVATRTASDQFTYARLVSSSEAVKSYFSDYSNSRYTDHGDGTVTDTKTGLMWMKCTYGQSYDSVTNSCSETGAAAGDWQAAFANAALANDASSLSYTDWRLPNIKELGSLVDFGKNAGIDTDTFPIFNNEATYYWSSTPTIVDNTPAAAFDQAVTIGFGTAQGGRYVGVEREITNGFAVHLRLVRDPD